MFCCLLCRYLCRNLSSAFVGYRSAALADLRDYSSRVDIVQTFECSHSIRICTFCLLRLLRL